jgi:small subunit ribosomal protein S17
MARKKKEEVVAEEIAAETQTESTEVVVEESVEPVKEAAKAKKPKKAEVVAEPKVNAADSVQAERGNRAQRVGVVTSDKMTKTVVVRVDRLIKHPKYRRYVRRKKQFMAHDELGSSIGDKVRIVETRPLSARKRWRVVEIVQKAAK